MVYITELPVEFVYINRLFSHCSNLVFWCLETISVSIFVILRNPFKTNLGSNAYLCKNYLFVTQQNEMTFR